MRIKMPAVRIKQERREDDEDALTCGVCQKRFALGDIVRFIQHKVKSCNKENYASGCEDSAANGGESSGGEGGTTAPRPSTPATPDLKSDSTPPHSSPEEGPSKKLRTDAQSNTINSEPSNYVCSTCKARMYSAWRLVQHVQNSHGIKIYVDSSSSSSSSSSGSSLVSSPGTARTGHNSSGGSTGSSGSVTNPRPPLSSPLVDPPLPLPFTVGGIMRMPVDHTPRQFPPTTPLFARPSSHSDHFRMEQLVSEQFRLGGLPLPPLVPPPPQRPPPPSLPLPIEPQLDFYSQRLRQLAGTTSPGTTSPSPRKHSPPFTSPPSLQPVPNNNNNNSTSNNNLSPHPESPKAADDSVDLTSAPLSASTPPAKSEFGPEEIKIHPCQYCGKKFRFQSNLIVHRRSHTGEKPFKCTVCNHACSQSSKLKRHMKVHKQKNFNSDEGINGNMDQNSNVGSDSGEDEDEDDDLEEDEEEMEEEEEDEDMDMEEEEGDDDEDGEAPEDLTTKSTSSTPPNENKEENKTAPGDKAGSLVGELMDKFGLNNIQQYSEAYKQALQESVGSQQICRKDDILQRTLVGDNNNLKPSIPNGLMEKSASIRIREEFAKLSGQQPLELVASHGLFGSQFEHPFDASKRQNKVDYPGLWLPAMNIHRDSMFGSNGADSLPDVLKSDKTKDGNPGPSASLAAAAAAAALNLGIPSQALKKDSRRNDTCEFCGKVFKNCSNLTVHRRSHTGEKPYKCELCSYACAQSSKLTRHMKTHGRMGKDVYRCRFCEMPFSVPSTLEKHMRKCVVNQNMKVDYMMPGIMSGDEDSTTSASKETPT